MEAHGWKHNSGLMSVLRVLLPAKERKQLGAVADAQAAAAGAGRHPAALTQHPHAQ